MMMQDTPAPVQIVAPVQQPGIATMGTDSKGRPTIDIAIDGRGPVKAIVDTGAERTVLSADLVRKLGLAPTGALTGVAGVAGGETAGSYSLRRLSSGLFDRRDITLLGLSSIGVTDAKAIIGMDLFRDRKLVIDRERRQLRTESSGPAPAGWSTVRGIVAPAGLIVPVLVNGIAMQALVDSGAEGCVAGPDVLKALGWDADDYRLTSYGQVSGASSGATGAMLGTMDRMTLGPVSIRNQRVVFLPQRAADGGDPFMPTMIVGLDLFARLTAYAVDLPRAEFQFVIAPAASSTR